jgi:hypothetical protein
MDIDLYAAAALNNYRLRAALDPNLATVYDLGRVLLEGQDTAPQQCKHS